jgi:hypothetical protein
MRSQALHLLDEAVQILVDHNTHHVISKGCKKHIRHRKKRMRQIDAFSHLSRISCM